MYTLVERVKYGGGTKGMGAAVVQPEIRVKGDTRCQTSV